MTPTDDAVAAAKRAARAGVRAGRRTRAVLPPDDPRRAAEAAAIAAAVLPHLPAAGATVATYVALPTEPPTDALNAAMAGRGLRVLAPLLRPDKDLDWVDLASSGAAGASPTPLGLDAIGAAALVVVPALQVDAAGRRLGQGGGSYDRALARRARDAIVVAVVDDDGLVDEVPHAPHDARVDAVVRPRLGWVALPIDEPICENDSRPEEWPTPRPPSRDRQPDETA